MLAKRKAAEKAESSDKENVGGSTDVLGEQEDPDVIF